MKVRTVVLIGAAAVLLFVGLLIYGLSHARGIPTVIEPPKRAVLQVPKMDRTLEMADGMDLAFWDGQPAVKVNLIYQMTILPWPKKLVPSVEVRAFRNDSDIYFHLAWTDETSDRLSAPATFADACAVMFPLGTNAEPASIIMGFLGKSGIWHWKADRDARFWNAATAPTVAPAYSDYYYPFEDEETLAISKDKQVLPVSDLLSVRVATVSPKPEQRVEGRGLWTNGQWRVVMKRALVPADFDAETDVRFGPDGAKVAAFGVWNGSAGDRGGRKSISEFVQLEWNEE